MTIVKLISLLLICSQLRAVELVQIDTGNAVEFSGVLNMKRNEEYDSCLHGTDMAMGLEDELKNIKSKPVDAKQFVWKPGSFKSMIDALRQAYDEKPKVLSLSFGGGVPNQLEESVLILHSMNDTVIVAAAGNEGNDEPYYPANYYNQCILSVGTTKNGVKTSYSNHAKVYLEYNKKDPEGTSSSTARMAGIVLKFRRDNPKLSCKKVVHAMQMFYGKLK
jgi:subtilisin family serine protease